MYRKHLLGIGLILVLLLLCVSASADGYPESVHPYESNTDQTWTYTHPTSLTYMKVTFSSDTYFENSWDFLYITDADGNQTRYTGSSLAGKTLYFRGSTITLRLTSDSSVNKYGFQITSIAAATQAEYDAPRYTVVNGTLTAFQGAVSSLSIPSTVDGQTVTAIGSSVFAGNTSLTSVTIPATVTQIGSNAFDGCAQLRTVTLANGLTEIGRYAFNQCTSLTSITLPNSVTTLGAYAFYGCTSLKTAALSGSLTVIGSDAFHNCAALTSITLPNSVTTLGAYAFYGCTSLKTASLSNGLSAIASRAFYGCTALTSITIPSGVESIGLYAFSGCISLETAALSSGLTTVGSSAFKDCTALTSVTLPNTVTKLDSSAFSGCTSLKTAALSSALTAIESGAFNGCAALTSITIPNSVTSLGSYAFYGCTSLKTAALSNHLTAIENNAFYNCEALTSIALPNTVTSLGSYVFSGCTSLRTATLSGGLSTIPGNTFTNCTALASVTIPNGVTGISGYAFSGCSALASVTVPESVTSIASSAFNKCGSLKIRVVRDSFAHQFALEQGIPFILQGEEEPQPTGTATTVSEKVAQIVAEVIHPGMTDYQKALALHNYLTLHANYDYTYTYYYADGVLLHETGVCQSYTLAYGMLLDAVGISNWRETGSNHTWNVARLDGVWCHIDVTWDDPGEGGYEHCEWFGITDYALEGVSSHERYSRQQPCDDYRISYVYKNGLLGEIVDEWREEIGRNAANGVYDIVIEGTMNYPHGIKERMAYQMFCDVGIELYGTTVNPESRFEFDDNNYTLYVTYDPSVQPAWTFSLPSSLKTVEEEAFMGIQAGTVKIPSGCTAIGDRAFAGSAIQAIYIPASVTAIGADAIPEGAAIFTPAGSTAAQWGRQRGYTVIETE